MVLKKNTKTSYILHVKHNKFRDDHPASKMATQE